MVPEMKAKMIGENDEYLSPEEPKPKKTLTAS